MVRHLLVAFVAFVTLAGCAAIAPPHAGQADSPVPLNVHWYRDSAEQKAVYIETYRAAAAAARSLSRGLADRSWGVILDIDETILDNSDYEKKARGVFDAKLWDQWIDQRAATVLPGAKEFIDMVRSELHGEVILVTNRPQIQCAATEDNLRAQRIPYDRILCDTTGKSDKNPRFDEVATGTPGVAAPLKVLIWVGDNIQDFPHLSQHSVSFQEFGVRYFALPNPIYGSWMGNPYR